MVSTIKTINHDRYNLEVSLNSIIKDGGSIYEFLQFVNIEDIISKIEKKYVRTPQFHVKGMIMLAISYHFNNKSYEKLLSNMTLFDIKILNFKKQGIALKKHLK